MTDEELAEAIAALRAANAEMADVEAKRASTDVPKSVRSTLSSFSNTSGGGVIILGLDEESGFSATGVTGASKLVSDLADMCAQEMYPPIRPVIGIHEFEDVLLIVAEVSELPDESKPCYIVRVGLERGSYVRVGESDFRLSSFEVQMLVASRGQPLDDRQPVSDASLADLREDSVSGLLARVRLNRPAAFEGLTDVDALRRLRAVTEDESGAMVPTFAGLLALGSYPQDYFPQLNVTFVHYPTVDGASLTTGERFMDNRTFDGSIPEMVRDALDTVRRNMSRRSVIKSAARQDVWEYPEPALREAIVNAIVHRDFSAASSGTQVQIEMYPDRLVIRNPGGLFGPVTVASLGEEGISSARNATLLRLLEDVEIPGETGTVCENRGSGIKVMLQSLRAAQMGLPEFIDRISSFSVTFPNHTLMSEETVTWLESLGQDDLTDSQCVALSLLRSGEVLTNERYRTQTRVDSRVATTELQDLVGRELVEQSGRRRWATYVLAAALTSDSGTGAARRTPADRREQLLRELGTETLSRAELAERTGLSSTTVRGWLLRLRKEDRVEITGGPPQSNKAKYRATSPYVGDGQQLSLGLERTDR